MVARRPLVPWLIAGAIGLLLASELVEALLARGPGPWRDLLVLLAASVAAGAAGAAALTSRRVLASPWAWFAAGCALWGLGAFVRALQGPAVRTAAAPLMLADLGFLGCAALLLVGMAVAAPSGLSALPRLRLLIDAMLLPVAFGLLAYLWIPLLGPGRDGSAGRDWHVLVVVTYWALYMAVAFSALLSYRKLDGDGAGRLAGRAAGQASGSYLIWGAVACSLGALLLGLASLGPRPGLPRVAADVSFLLGFALIALAAIEARQARLAPAPTPTPEAATPRGWGGRRRARHEALVPPLPLLPWWPSGNLPLVSTAVAFAVLVCATVAYLVWADTRPAVFLGAVGLLALVLVRQLITLRENERLIARQRVSGELEARLHEVGLALNRLEKSDTVLELVCQAGQRVFQADTVILWRADRRQGVLECVAAVGERARNFVAERRVLRLDDDQALATRVYTTGKTERVPHALPVHHSDGFLTIQTKARCLLAVPLVSNQQRLGVLVFGHEGNPEAFVPDDVIKGELLAAQAVVAMENAKLYGELARRLAEVESLYELSQATTHARTYADVLYLRFL
jgi:hypothetical protein